MDFIEKISNTNFNNDKKKIKKKLNKYQKKILYLDHKYILKTIKFIDYDKIDVIQKNIYNYKLIVNILYSNPEFYSELKYIQIDYSRKFNELNEVIFLEIIWEHEHYEYIEQIRTCENDIIELIIFANKYNIITYIQYKFVKKTLKKINEIFESDKSINKLYGIKQDIITIITKSHLELFFDIFDIILLKINLIKKTNYKIFDIYDISNNYIYTNLIKKIKFNLKKLIINI